MKKAFYFGKGYRQFEYRDYATYVTFYGFGQKDFLTLMYVLDVRCDLSEILRDFYHDESLEAGVLCSYNRNSSCSFIRGQYSITIFINSQQHKFDAKVIDKIKECIKEYMVEYSKTRYGFDPEIMDSLKYVYITFNESKEEYLKYDPDNILYTNACYGLCSSALLYRHIERVVEEEDSSLLNYPGPDVHEWVSSEVKKWEEYVKERYNREINIDYSECELNDAMHKLLVDKSTNKVFVQIIKDKPAPFKYYCRYDFVFYRFLPVEQ